MTRTPTKFPPTLWHLSTCCRTSTSISHFLSRGCRERPLAQRKKGNCKVLAEKDCRIRKQTTKSSSAPRETHGTTKSCCSKVDRVDWFASTTQKYSLIAGFYCRYRRVVVAIRRRHRVVVTALLLLCSLTPGSPLSCSASSLVLVVDASSSRRCRASSSSQS